MAEPRLGIDVILGNIGPLDTRSGFELAQWVRSHRSELEVWLAGSLDAIAQTAVDLCQAGPHLARSYEPEGIVDHIRQLTATRDRA